MPDTQPDTGSGNGAVVRPRTRDEVVKVASVLSVAGHRPKSLTNGRVLAFALSGFEIPAGIDGSIVTVDGQSAPRREPPPKTASKTAAKTPARRRASKRSS